MESFTNLLSCLGLVFFIIIPEVSGEYCTYYSGLYQKSKYCSGGCCGSSDSTVCCAYYSSSYSSVRLISGIISSLVFFLLFIGLVVCCCRRRRNPTTVMRTANPTMVYSSSAITTSNLQPNTMYYPPTTKMGHSQQPIYPTAPQYAPSPPTYDSLVFAGPQGKDNAAYDGNNLNKT